MSYTKIAAIYADSEALSGQTITVALVNTTKGNTAVAGGSAAAVVGA